MKKILFIIIISLFFSVSVAGAEEISTVLVGGWGGDVKQLEFLNREIPNSSIVMEDSSTSIILFAGDSEDLSAKAEELRAKMDALGITKANFIGYCYGGLVVRRFAQKYPGKVARIVVIATPNNGYKIRRFGANIFVSEDIPLFVIAGNKSSRYWVLEDESNDGTVDNSSTLSIPISGDAKVFPLKHLELIQSVQVVKQINAWLE